MRKKVLDFIREYNMLEAQDRVVVGVSAGPDSVCLLLMLLEVQTEIPFQVGVVHVNHNLRGEDARADEDFVRKLCGSRQIDFSAYSYDVAQIAVREKLSVEEAGRKVRYEAFADYAKKWGGTKIALAHHKNDVAETMIHNLARGTGLAGMSSMRPVRGNIIRPLLCMNRREIEHYLEDNHIDYHTDSTNEEDHYTRNRIRHHVIEYLTEHVNTRAVAHMAEASLLIRESQDYLLEQAAKAAGRYVEEADGKIRIDVALFEEHPVIQKYVLRSCIGSSAGGLKNITQEHLYMLGELAYREVGKKIHLPRGICVEKEYQALLFTGQSEKPDQKPGICVPLQIPGTQDVGDVRITCVTESNTGAAIPEKMYTKWLDYDKMKGNVVLRNRQPGDYMIINEANGRKKLKNYFIDEKIPQKDRDHLLLLACGPEILWVIGYRINAYYKVSSDTKEIIKIQVQGGNNHE